MGRDSSAGRYRKRDGIPFQNPDKTEYPNQNVCMKYSKSTNITITTSYNYHYTLISLMEVSIIPLVQTKVASTDNEAIESICRLLGLRANKPTLGVQHAICLHHIRIVPVFSHPSEDSENHATSHVNLDTKSHRSHLQALPTDLELHYQWFCYLIKKVVVTWKNNFLPYFRT